MINKQELIARLDIIFQTYPSNLTNLTDEKTVEDFRADVQDGNVALSDLISNLRTEVDNELFDLVMELEDNWYKFYESIKNVEITIGSINFLLPFLEIFTKLKQYAGIVKK